jgi:hypothetical protein
VAAQAERRGKDTRRAKVDRREGAAQVIQAALRAGLAAARVKRAAKQEKQQQQATAGDGDGDGDGDGGSTSGDEASQSAAAAADSQPSVRASFQTFVQRLPPRTPPLPLAPWHPTDSAAAAAAAALQTHSVHLRCDLRTLAKQQQQQQQGQQGAAHPLHFMGEGPGLDLERVHTPADGPDRRKTRALKGSWGGLGEFWPIHRLGIGYLPHIPKVVQGTALARAPLARCALACNAIHRWYPRETLTLT